MKNIAAIIGVGSLICAVLAAVLSFAGTLSNDQYKTAFLIFSIIWFVAAFIWLRGNTGKAEI